MLHNKFRNIFCLCCDFSLFRVFPGYGNTTRNTPKQYFLVCSHSGNVAGNNVSATIFASSRSALVS
jgi:hypothetical protein